MQTSSKSLLVESAVIGALAVGASMIAWPVDLGLSAVVLHPAWLAIIVLAARYGPAGLFSAFAAVVVPIAAIAMIRSGGTDVVVARFAARPDLIPLIAATAVAWIAMSHHGRLARLKGRYGESQLEQERLGHWADALEASVGYLRSRCDRIDASVQLWRRTAQRIERGDLAQAADAALELCMIRTGATAGSVERFDRGSRTVVCRRGRWQATDAVTRGLLGDETIGAAIQQGVTRLAADVCRSSHADSDVAVPVIDQIEGTVLGAVALRGADPARLRPAELRDLETIAEWLSPALAREARGPRLRAVGAGRSG